MTFIRVLCGRVKMVVPPGLLLTVGFVELLGFLQGTGWWCLIFCIFAHCFFSFPHMVFISIPIFLADIVLET